MITNPISALSIFHGTIETLTIVSFTRLTTELNFKRRRYNPTYSSLNRLEKLCASGRYKIFLIFCPTSVACMILRKPRP